MTLQGFNGRSLQGVYGVLQGFGNQVFRESTPDRLFVYDGKVYVTDIATSSVKIYDLDGLKLDEFIVESKTNPIITSMVDRLGVGNSIFVDATRIIVNVGGFSVIYNHSGVELSSAYGNGFTSVFYNEELYLPARSFGSNSFRVYDLDANLVRSFSVSSFQQQGYDVKAGKVYYVGQRFGSSLYNMILKVMDTDGDTIDEFQYWGKPPFPGAATDEIGNIPLMFVAYGDYCHSMLSGTQTVYRNSTVTGAELNKFTLDTGDTTARHVTWHNNELYYTTNASSIMVFDDTTGEFIREWSTID